MGPKGIAAPQNNGARVEYFEKSGNLREALVDSEAESVAKKLAAEKLTPTQIRAYYFEVLTLRRRVELECANASEEEAEAIFLRYRPELKLLRAKVHYARARGTIKDEMKDFMERHVRAVVKLRDFRAFCAHFEAVVAFHRGLAERR